MAPPFRLTFPRSSSSAYREAVRLAKQSPAYAETQDGRQLVHAATFGTSPDEVATLAELWGLVGGWKGVRLEAEGDGVLPRERARVGEVLECAARAATFPEPAAYCTSAPPAGWSPWLGCTRSGRCWRARCWTVPGASSRGRLQRPHGTRVASFASRDMPQPVPPPAARCAKAR